MSELQTDKQAKAGSRCVCVCVCKAGGRGGSGLSGRGQNDVLSQGGAGEGPMTWVPDTLPGMLRLVVVRSR